MSRHCYYCGTDPDDVKKLVQALIDLYSVAHVGRDEDYAAVTNAAVLIERLTGLRAVVGSPPK